MYPYIYECRYWNDIDFVEEFVQGCTFADTWEEAMAHVYSFYGEDLIDVKLTCLEEQSVLELPEGVGDQVIANAM